MANREWDLTSNNALQAAAKWLLEKSGALLVVIIRVDDLAIAADPGCAPRESHNLIEDRIAELHERLERERHAARELADRKRVREEKRANR
jgi:hypothetical protein